MMHKTGWWLGTCCLILLLGNTEALASSASLREKVDPKSRITLEQAQALFFPEHTTFSPLNSKRMADAYREAGRLAGVPATFPRFKVWQAEIDGTFHGLLFTDEAIGKQDRFDYAVATDANNRIIGVRILRYRESHGYEIMQRWWLEQFNSLGPESAILRGEEIDAISGATLSVDHLSQGVRRLVRFAELINPVGHHEPSR